MTARNDRVALYGLCAVGRRVLRAWLERDGEGIELAAIGLCPGDDPRVLAHLLAHDSHHGALREAVSVEGDRLIIGARSIPLVRADAPAGLPWGKLGIDLVIVATDAERGEVRAADHLEAGADKVLLTVPSELADITLICGVNQADYRPGEHDVVAIGSDTTHALAPLVVALMERLPIEDAMVTAVHAYTGAQKLVDEADSDLRRARAAATSIVPTSTRAPEVISRALPALAGHLCGYGVRVPVPTVSIIELTLHFAREVSAEEINDVLRSAAEGDLEGWLAVSEEELVSSDYIGCRSCAVVDAPLTLTIGPLAKVSAWYDNEMGHAHRVVDAAAGIIRAGRSGADSR